MCNKHKKTTHHCTRVIANGPGAVDDRRCETLTRGLVGRSARRAGG